MSYRGRVRDSKVLLLLNRDRCRNAGYIQYPLYQQTNILGTVLIKTVEILDFYIFQNRDLGQHRKSESLFIILAHWSVTTGPKYVIVHIFIKYSGFFPNSRK